MIKKTARMFVLTAAFAAVQSFAAPPHQPQFEKVHPQALKYLKAEQGKPIKTGIVIVNGRYIKPPYKVVRWGNAIKINDIQVTDQLVSWNSFLALQNPANVQKTVSGPAPSGPAPAEPKAAPEDVFDDDLSMYTPPAPSMASWVAVSTGDPLDDLFGDDDEPPARPTRQAGGSNTPRRPSPPKPPAPQVTYTLTGEFERNARVDALVKKINVYRTRIDKQLRDGGLCMFGVRANPKLLDRRQAQEFINAIPEILRDSKTGPELISRLRSKGIHYVDPLFGPMFIANRADYLQYQAIREEIKRDAATRRALGGY